MGVLVVAAGGGMIADVVDKKTEQNKRNPNDHVAETNFSMRLSNYLMSFHPLNCSSKQRKW